jgi:hypothetical protein
MYDAPSFRISDGNHITRAPSGATDAATFDGEQVKNFFTTKIHSGKTELLHWKIPQAFLLFTES